ncbi:hypothetical protein [Glutamicibacter sp. MCAF14]|uniref:hypothetical protein n=1 Tax=Glutamicibacter sp. MCAF14 TaxID=3233043 RepID=UPI003F915E08
MSTKTFHDDDRKLEVQENEGQINLYIEGEINELGINLAPSDAPALALAILEAAGHRPVAYDPERLAGDDLLAYIAHRLAVHVGDEAKRTAKAKDKAELEAEALELYKAAYPVHADWDWKSVANTDKWLAVARRAREMKAEK